MDKRSGWMRMESPLGITIIQKADKGRVSNRFGDVTLDFLKERGYRITPAIVLDIEEQYLSLDTLVKEIEEWQAQTFPDSTHDGVLDHLLEEVDELVRDPESWEELADVFFLLVAAAKKANVSLTNAARAKLMINRGRTWGEPSANGKVNHVRENE